MQDRLQKFACLVDTGSFTKAAARLHISQPALTAAVQKLERELKAELLVRQGHAFTVTTAGQAVYDSARAIAAQTHNLKTRLSEIVRHKILVRVGMIDSIADLLFVHDTILPKLEQNAQVSLVVDNSARLTTYVEHDELDMAYIAQPGTLPHTLTAEYIADEPLALVCQPAIAGTVQDEMAQGVLHNFLSYNQNSQTHRLIAQYFERLRITVQPAFYSTSPEIMLKLVLTQRAAAVLPFLLVQPHIQKGALTRLDAGSKPVIARQIVCLRRNGRLLPGAAAELTTQAQTRLAVLHANIAYRAQNSFDRSSNNQLR